ncbi:ABC transporter permease [Paenibacillus nasutitermitis]|uniref:Sugar ABC transporter permease n=1 Tax=Paenibacillus nasutitermitis TaxID=1652958 RepID=A0A916ZFH6_9BACL|nr:ABC transporter permease subunit [Paenibacillus nasutitermitis]GGD94775.1 sugar ABC transporter permease [Paenibacillus nasutitermitis]
MSSEKNLELAASPLSSRKQNWNPDKWKAVWPLLVMTVPFFSLMFIFSYVPLWGWYIAFTNYFPGDSFLKAEFVGFKHFQTLFNGGFQFQNAMRNTLIFSGLGLLLSPLPMIFAIMLNEIRAQWFKKLVQTVTSFPNFISWVIVYSIFFSFFSLDDGFINRLLLNAGLISNATDLLANSDIVWVFQTGIGLWKGLGWSAIIYIASIASLDQELFQAAEVDGAGRFKQIWHIMIPGLMPTFAVLFLLGIGQFLSVGFEQYYTFDNPLVHSKIDVLDTYVYNLGLLQLNYPFSTAVGIFKSVISIILVFSANYTYKLTTGRGII